VGDEAQPEAVAVAAKATELATGTEVGTVAVQSTLQSPCAWAGRPGRISVKPRLQINRKLRKKRALREDARDFMIRLLWAGRMGRRNRFASQGRGRLSRRFNRTELGVWGNLEIGTVRSIEVVRNASFGSIPADVGSAE
jgi:hypothetical protein